MFLLYRWLLHLYPAAYRYQYCAEMAAVFLEAQEETWKKGLPAQAGFCARELRGLLGGALKEHARVLFGFYDSELFSSKGPAMGSEFRFPKLTAPLMTFVLAFVVAAIEKGKTIRAFPPRSSSHSSLALQPHFTFLVIITLMLIVVYIASMVVLRRHHAYRKPASV
jgi:hypothetical protein